MEFAVERYKTERWRQHREEWRNKIHPQEQGQVNQDIDESDRPGRVVFVSGFKGRYTEDKSSDSKQWYFRGTSKSLPRSTNTHLCVFEHDMPDNTNSSGSLIFEIYDAPLTAHQKERTKRNRYLITEQEQQRLLGIVGLSTGSVALEALLREGVGGIYRLADFDSFELSNGNRMLFNKGDVGR
jgi:hypothetical protein